MELRVRASEFDELEREWLVELELERLRESSFTFAPCSRAFHSDGAAFMLL